MWSSLVPLIIGSAVLPLQLIVTLVLLRSPSGLRSGAAFVCGMTATRLLQGLLLGILLQVTALRQTLTGQDPDAPPPRWLARAASMKPSTAFGFGMALIAVGAK